MYMYAHLLIYCIRFLLKFYTVFGVETGIKMFIYVGSI